MNTMASWARLWTLVAVACLAVGAPACGQDAGSLSRTLGLRLGGDAAATRVVLDLADAPRTRISVMAAGSQILILAPEMAATAPRSGRGQGLVKGWAATSQNTGSQNTGSQTTGARISLDIADGAVVQRRFLLPPSVEGAPWRYVVDLAQRAPATTQALSAPARVARADVPTPARDRAAAPRPDVADDGLAALAEEIRGAQAPAPSRTPPARVVAASLPEPRGRAERQKVIIIDAGHGGHDTGAQSLVRNEKDINLAAALDLKARLERSGRYRVVLTRSTDVFIPLEQRVRIARNARADLFISLHSDSAGADPTPHGASIYTLSDHGVTRVHDVIGPHELFMRGADQRSDPAVSQILLDLTQRNTRNRSAEFAGMLLDHISGNVDLLSRTQRDANYYVLLAPDVPAVLLEMGFITNPSDELRLTDPDKRRQMMDHVGDAIDDYFAPTKQLAAR